MSLQKKSYEINSGELILGNLKIRKWYPCVFNTCKEYFQTKKEFWNHILIFYKDMPIIFTFTLDRSQTLEKEILRNFQPNTNTKYAWEKKYGGQGRKTKNGGTTFIFQCMVPGVTHYCPAFFRIVLTNNSQTATVTFSMVHNHMHNIQAKLSSQSRSRIQLTLYEEITTFPFTHSVDLSRVLPIVHEQLKLLGEDEKIYKSIVTKPYLTSTLSRIFLFLEKPSNFIDILLDPFREIRRNKQIFSNIQELVVICEPSVIKLPGRNMNKIITRAQEENTEHSFEEGKDKQDEAGFVFAFACRSELDLFSLLSRKLLSWPMQHIT